MKKIVFIAIYFILFLLGAIVNWEAMASGGRATVTGFSVSLLFACVLLILPFLGKKEKGFINFSLVFTVFLSVASIIGILKYSGNIASDFVIPLIVLPLALFSGLKYILPLNVLYPVLITLSLISTALSTLILFKKGKAKS